MAKVMMYSTGVCPFCRMAERLLDPHRRLDELSAGDLDVRARIDGGYRLLDAAERTALQRFGVAADAELTPARMAELLHTSPGGAERIADRLAGARLLEDLGAAPGSPPRYRISGLVRLYAREQVQIP